MAGPLIDRLPQVRGRLSPAFGLAAVTWLRVGGPAEVLFQPADPEDLMAFLGALDPEIPVFPMGVGSNLIVRDGGLRGVVIRLGRGFNEIAVEEGEIRAGAAALDAHVARKAADAGRDLTFLRTIPGAVGGAVRMNAGCYGAYVSDHLVGVDAITRSGERITLRAEDLRLGYRSSELPEGCVLTGARFAADPADPETLHAHMQGQLERRDATQPTRERSAGSTFRNPSGASSTGRADDSHALKAWKLIDDAGLRGARRGGAQMSPKHPNFLVNADDASAADLEALGEEVRDKVFQNSQIRLEWEIRRVGDPAVPER
ncbi:UDP-N-acetylmuramate dehydrogenase [Profundibacterium mesophilum]|uniref:UDP-N-acetylenolpyruvoylglucosamine reductase n=1 Tax=Profundibacterium mesophilum KAUST100406-0324 TaxID=1037889 RepID=A0A921NVB1_9RHOB|nr:UDP-N-acetylmuramate dehydrogenase [Profundibacterium mesophilum]KAF0675459.1 UDP-N-acetylenolpyruvoylglucosamine reductase [Profundibacterium mesophilum KAUST100406-0324]